MMVGLVSPYLGDQSVWQIINDQERLELERDAISSISVDLGLDLLTGTVTRAPVDHAMTI